MSGVEPLIKDTTTYKLPPFMPNQRCLLTLNRGSSNLRFSVFEVSDTPKRLLSGSVNFSGGGEHQILLGDAAGDQELVEAPEGPATRSGTDAMLDWLELQPIFPSIMAVGHRVVQGWRHFEPTLVGPKLLEDLREIASFDPEHLPQQLDLIAAVEKRYPDWPQVVCFDTEFHQDMPSVAKMLPLPRCYTGRGLERHGFHGLSYAYLMQELLRLGESTADQGKVILAHLGSSASVAAVRDGWAVDTSTGFSPAAGLMMGTRSGDLDPGVILHLLEDEMLDVTELRQLVTHESGLLGVSGISADMRVLLDSKAPEAAEAVELFCYQARKWIGALAAALDGVDCLVFSGGIGENVPAVRERICRGLSYLGVDLDSERNLYNSPFISSRRSRIPVRVIHTDEEMMIARALIRVLELTPSMQVHAV